MTLLKTIRLASLKRTASKHYKAYYKRLSSFSCGAMIAEYASLELREHKTRFNETMDKLAELDPNTPKARL